MLYSLNVNKLDVFRSWFNKCRILTAEQLFCTVENCLNSSIMYIVLRVL